MQAVDWKDAGARDAYNRRSFRFCARRLEGVMQAIVEAALASVTIASQSVPIR